MDTDKQRIESLQNTVISLRRQMPKAYCKLLKIENKHFHSNLQNGACTIPDELRGISFSRAEQTLGRCLNDIDTLASQQQQDDRATAAAVEQVLQRAHNLQIARQMLCRLQRRSAPLPDPQPSASNSALTSNAAATTVEPVV